jgi:hypothetical protein
MIWLLEFLFRRTMRVYWFSARYTGRTAGINEVRALIYNEIRVLALGSGHDTGQRIAELKYILSQMKKLTNHVD